MALGSMAPTLTAIMKFDTADFASGRKRISREMLGLNKDISKLGGSFTTASGQIVKFSSALQTTSKMGIRAMLNLKSFVAKIVHYITFSIAPLKKI